MLLYEDHSAIVTAIAFSPDGSFQASGGRDGTIVIRDSHGDTKIVRESIAKDAPVHSLAFLTAASLVFGHADGWEIFKLVDSNWENAGGLPPFAIRVTSLAAFGATRIVYGTGKRTSSETGIFQIHDLATGRSIQPTFREPFGVRAVAACPAQKLVAWSTGNKEFKVWDIRKQTPLSFRSSHTASALALAPDGSAVAAVQDWAVRMYDLNAKQDRPPLKGHKGVVSCVAFSPDGLTVATGSWDGTVRFWDPRTGRERAVFQWPVGKVFSLAFAPDGQRAAAGGDGGGVVVWDVE